MSLSRVKMPSVTFPSTLTPEVRNELEHLCGQIQDGFQDFLDAFNALAFVTPPADPVQSVQFNDGGVFGGSEDFTFDESTTTVHVGAAGQVVVGGSKVVAAAVSHADGASFLGHDGEAGTGRIVLADADGEGYGVDSLIYRGVWNSPDPSEGSDTAHMLRFYGFNDVSFIRLAELLAWQRQNFHDTDQAAGMFDFIIQNTTGDDRRIVMDGMTEEIISNFAIKLGTADPLGTGIVPAEVETLEGGKSAMTIGDMTLPWIVVAPPGGSTYGLEQFMYRGTVASPTASQSGDFCELSEAFAFDGTDFFNIGQVWIEQREAIHDGKAAGAVFLYCMDLNGDYMWAYLEGLTRQFISQVPFAGPGLDLTPLTFSTLPTPVFGMVRVISDANTTTWGANVTSGGGTDKIAVFYNNTNWTVFGK